MKTTHVVLALLAVAALAGSARADERGAKTLKTTPLQAAWQVSVDGGRTFADAMPAQVDPKVVKTVVARGTFEVADPAAVACLWLSMDNKETQPTNQGGFCLGDSETAGGAECGLMPLWQHAKVEVNGKAVAGPLPGMTYRQLPIQGDVLVKGKNTLTVSGDPWQINAPPAIGLKPLKLTAAAPQAAEIGVGPVLGMIGPDFFTVSVRTRIPAAVKVTADSGGKTASVTSPVGFYHQLKVPLTKGSRSFQYTVASTCGGQTVSKGPFEAAAPAFEGDSLRFVAMGNTRCNIYADMNAPGLIAGMIKSKPDLFVNAGQVVELPSWDLMWEHMATYEPLVSTVPTYVAYEGRDHVGMTYGSFAGLAGDKPVQNWTQAFGPVRLIGIDGIYDWSADSENAKWLEGVLKDSKEKFVFVFNHYPGYTSGGQSRPRAKGAPMWAPLQQCRDVVNPMLARYKVTALVSAFEYCYERCEVTAPQGVPAIIVGGGGTKVYRLSNRGAANNPFVGKGVFLQAISYAVFDVKGDTCKLTAYGPNGATVLDQREFKSR